jgi:transmembrane sensor
MVEMDVERLIVRYLSNEATSKEIEALLEWVSLNNNNLKFFNECVNTWSQRTQNELYDVNAALGRFNKRIDRFEDENREKSFSWSWIAIAASLVFFMIAGAWIYFWNTQETSASLATLTATLSRDTLALSDGSIIYLTKNSTIEYPMRFEAGTRDVFLTGEAFFEVSRDPARPFIIHTGNIQTQVLGTSFNVNAAKGIVDVVVETGKVMVGSSGFKEILNPADRIVFNNQSESVKRSRVDLEKEFAWRYNVIIFEDSKLSDVAETLKAHFGVTLTFGDDRVKEFSITGRYRNESLETILKAIEFSTDVRFHVDGKSIRVFSRDTAQKTN